MRLVQLTTPSGERRAGIVAEDGRSVRLTTRDHSVYAIASAAIMSMCANMCRSHAARIAGCES